MTAYVGGTFDLFHIGHVSLLRTAKASFDKVVVSLNTDEFAMRYKGKFPIFSLYERIQIIESCKYVDSVVVNVGDEDSTIAISVVKPDVIIHGDDWELESLKKQMGITDKFLDETGIRFVFLSYTENISSTKIREHLAASTSRS